MSDVQLIAYCLFINYSILKYNFSYYPSNKSSHRKKHKYQLDRLFSIKYFILQCSSILTPAWSVNTK